MWKRLITSQGHGRHMGMLCWVCNVPMCHFSLYNYTRWQFNGGVLINNSRTCFISIHNLITTRIHYETAISKSRFKEYVAITIYIRKQSVISKLERFLYKISCTLHFYDCSVHMESNCSLHNVRTWLCRVLCITRFEGNIKGYSLGLGACISLLIWSLSSLNALMIKYFFTQLIPRLFQCNIRSQGYHKFTQVS